MRSVNDRIRFVLVTDIVNVNYTSKIHRDTGLRAVIKVILLFLRWYCVAVMCKVVYILYVHIISILRLSLLVIIRECSPRQFVLPIFQHTIVGASARSFLSTA